MGSLIQEHSEECGLSPFELFSVPPTQIAVEKSSDIPYQPQTQLRDGTSIDFFVPGQTEEYIDLQNTKLETRFKITKENGDNLTAADVVAPINDIHNSAFNNVELYMNDRLMSHSNNMHGYRNVISHLIHDSEESLKSERSMRLIYKDTPNQMDVTEARKANPEQLIPGFHVRTGVNNEGHATYTLIPPAEVTGNQGLHQRYLYTRQSREVQVIGNLGIDMFEQERYLIPGVGMKLRFHRQKNPFMLMAPNGSTFKVELLDVKLHVRQVKASPGVQLGHADALAKTNAKYPLCRKECKSYAVPAGLQNFHTDSIFQGQLPKRLVVGMVDGDAFAGVYNKNPYNFKTMNVNFMQLYSNGEPVQVRALKPNIERGRYLNCYETLFRGLNKMDGEKSSIIKREDWDKGFALFAFDLTPDMDADDHYALIKHGNLRLEIEFAAALERTIEVIVYAEFDNIVEITSDHHVAFDHV